MRSGDTAHRAHSIPVPAALCVSSQRCPNACVANKETSGPHSASNQRARQPASGLHPITLTLTLTLTRTLTLPGPDPIPALTLTLLLTLPLTLTLTLRTEEVFILETQPPRRRATGFHSRQAAFTASTASAASSTASATSSTASSASAGAPAVLAFPCPHRPYQPCLARRSGRLWTLAARDP